MEIRWNVQSLALKGNAQQAPRDEDVPVDDSGHDAGVLDDQRLSRSAKQGLL